MKETVQFQIHLGRSRVAQWYCVHAKWIYWVMGHGMVGMVGMVMVGMVMVIVGAMEEEEEEGVAARAPRPTRRRPAWRSTGGQAVPAPSSPLAAIH